MWNNYIRERALFKSEKSEPKVMLPFSQEKKKLKMKCKLKAKWNTHPFFRDPVLHVFSKKRKLTH